MQQQNMMKLQSTIKYNSTSPAWRFFSNSFKRSCGSTKNQPTHPSQLWHLRMVLFSQQPIWILNPETSPNISRIIELCPLKSRFLKTGGWTWWLVGPDHGSSKPHGPNKHLYKRLVEGPCFPREEYTPSPPSPQTQLRAVRVSHHFVHAELGGLSG